MQSSANIKTMSFNYLVNGFLDVYFDEDKKFLQFDQINFCPDAKGEELWKIRMAGYLLRDLSLGLQKLI